ncbi:response regulator transcription factor [Arthrobacter sp. NPDC056691]|uniref:response regulator transcription factor n=1 Tax=Arthrobacter sp. NPDC056691 TaxID=3345913 RepID=UPI003671F83E
MGSWGSRGVCLVIEDDQDIRNLLTLILTGIGFEVHAVSSARDAVRAAKALPLVLVTVDLGLPDGDGLDVAHDIRKLSDAPLLIVTAHAEPHDELAGLASGAAAYLVKPFRPRELTELVDRICPAGTPLASMAAREVADEDRRH